MPAKQKAKTPRKRASKAAPAASPTPEASVDRFGNRVDQLGDPLLETPTPDPSAVRRAVKFDRESDSDAGVLTMTEQLSGEVFVFVLSALPVEVRVKAAHYGIVRKIDNSKDPVEAARQIMAGGWPGRVVKTGKTAKPKRYAMPVEAIHRVSGRALEDCKATWDSLNETQKKELKLDHRILAAIDAIRGERSGAKQVESSVVDALIPGPAVQHQYAPGGPPTQSGVTTTVQAAIPPQPAPQLHYDDRGNIILQPEPGLSTPTMSPPWAPPNT